MITVLYAVYYGCFCCHMYVNFESCRKHMEWRYLSLVEAKEGCTYWKCELHL